MATNEKQALGMSLQISQDFIDNLAKELVEESLINTLNSKDEIVKQLISSILSVKVNAEGKISTYSSDNRYTYMQYLIEKMLKQEIVSVAEEVMNEKREDIRKVIKNELSKKSTMDKLYDVFFSNVTESLTARYTTNIDINFKKKIDY